MHKINLYARTGATAIAAVLTLSSTSISAQEIALPEAVIVTSEPIVSTPAASGPAAAVSIEAVTEPAPTKAVKTATVPVAKAAKRTVTKAAPAAVAAAPVAGPIAATSPSAVNEPFAAESATPAQLGSAAAPVPKPLDTSMDVVDSETAALAVGGALAAIALGGAAMLVSRRRRTRAEMAVVPVIAIQPTAASAPVYARNNNHGSAFAWGPRAQPAEPNRRLSPMAQAKMGPTPENPSLSLKKRLKRAAFFEQRERAAGAGEAVPVARIAGLPERAVAALRNDRALPSQRLAFQPA
ncbi:MAG: hypothetical protein ABIO29_02070 [Sphingomicrobium sp.]